MSNTVVVCNKPKGQRAPARQTEVALVITKDKKKRVRNRKPREGVGAEVTPTKSDIGSVNTRQQESGKSRLQRLLFAPCMSEEGQAFVRYHLDPAGYHESGGKKQRMVYIPDGALAKGVGGENRQIDMVSCPAVTPATVPLDGSQWSATIISFGTYRLNFVVLASVLNEEVTADIRRAFAHTVNDFTYDANRVVFPYLPLLNPDGSVVANWFWKPVFNKQTSALPEPAGGVSTTVDKWRTVGSSLTLMFNAPTLINQGYVSGGQFAREIQSVTTEESTVTFRGVLSMSGQNVIPAYLSGNLVEALFETTSLSNTWLVPNLAAIGGLNLVTTRIATSSIMQGTTEFAVKGDVISLTAANTNFGTPVLMNNVTQSTNITIGTIGGLAGTTTDVELESIDFEGVMNTTRNVVVLPPMTLSDIISNDPDCEAAVLRQSTGVYGVHVKTAAPVYEFASATSFGPMNLATPGYAPAVGGTAGGFRDTLDPNVGTIVVCFMGMSQAANIVAKRFFTWEGMPSDNSTLGQFAATGGEKDETALEFVDNFAGTHNNMYAARDNFFGKIAQCLQSLIGSVRAHEATPSVISGLAGIAKDTLRSLFLHQAN